MTYVDQDSSNTKQDRRNKDIGDAHQAEIDILMDHVPAGKRRPYHHAGYAKGKEHNFDPPVTAKMLSAPDSMLF
jgi:hypothetical protein